MNIAPQLPFLSIGDSFQGGKVAYLYTIGDGGYDANLVQGIVAAEVDEVTTLNWWEVTASIDIKTTNGYTDWYLPSLAVLDVLYTNRAAIGGFNDSSRYWSSNENGVGGDAAVQVVFSDGTHTVEYKSDTYPARAIRFFSVAKEAALNIDGNIILSGSLIQQVNYAPFGSGSSSGATQLDITKDIHLIDISGIETNCYFYLPNGLYDGQVVRFALKGDGIASPNYVFIWMDYLRRYDGTIQSNISWKPFYDNENGSARSLATAVYIDGAWNIDTDFLVL